ncbi:MAG: rsuA [Candidatus Nomurabacteria bacterium]|nr:rsuA [Candidatus Nomurabacteria bacterium]
MKIITVNAKTPIRINIYLRDQGVGSRREIDEYIKNKFITIHGKAATLGSKVATGDIIKIDNPSKDLIYALYYKKRGEVTGRLNELSGCEPIGRLDKESEGLLLYTNDFRVVDALLNPKHGREKEYEVVVREKMTPRVITLLKKGIRTREATYAPVKSVTMYGENRSLRIVLTEGKKHEIRRMLNALNLTILSLKRTRILSFVSHGLKAGAIHYLSPKQISSLLLELGIEDKN